MEKIKKIAVVSAFAIVLVGIMVIQMLLPDLALSEFERRKLAQAPEITAEAIFSGDYFADLEEYLLDQFPARQRFRALKALFQYQILGMKDNNGLYQADGHLMKLDYPLNTSQASMAIGKFNAMIAAHPEMHQAYYSIIPDKNYFLAEANGYPTMDYAALLEAASSIQGQYIDIFPYLTVDDFYTTDSHWRQECIVPVAQALASAMGTHADGQDAYTPESRPGFYGVYAGQSAVAAKPDSITVMHSPVTDSAIVTSPEHPNETLPVYNWDDFQGMDPYDTYLSGPEALLEIENPLAENNRHLVLFRDSFGSSISPLLLSAYRHVTVVDLRYMTSAIVHQTVDFENADVLFLYSTGMFNAGATIK